MKNNNHRANQLNPNKGTKGVNTVNAKANGNRGKQLNPIPNNANRSNPKSKTT